MTAQPPPPDARRLERATRIAWIGCATLGVVFVGFGLYSGIASVTSADRSMAAPDLIMALIGVGFGAITLVGAARLRRREPSGVRFASTILRFILVLAGGNLVFSLVNGLGQNWAHFVWSLVATVVAAVLVAALEQLRAALSPRPGG
ncbi:hypothetical protein [Amycolatopsis nalaikhensis]|uniref:Integral membrane protein n=1 Tax=Amycolatopsis nalaikhensis TaxID=715472 RepID=A0ABY8XUC4_9PSEU|nr:hypothetical protein [Amycolatopsis sp. 2-2]WIV59222.1 hypothetical protein QP939_11625 [Amycolatopsis sp. 2-2]